MLIVPSLYVGLFAVRANPNTRLCKCHIQLGQMQQQKSYKKKLLPSYHFGRPLGFSQLDLITLFILHNMDLRKLCNTNASLCPVGYMKLKKT